MISGINHRAQSVSSNPHFETQPIDTIIHPLNQSTMNMNLSVFQNNRRNSLSPAYSHIDNTNREYPPRITSSAHNNVYRSNSKGPHSQARVKFTYLTQQQQIRLSQILRRQRQSYLIRSGQNYLIRRNDSMNRQQNGINFRHWRITTTNINDPRPNVNLNQIQRNQSQNKKQDNNSQSENKLNQDKGNEMEKKNSLLGIVKTVEFEVPHTDRNTEFIDKEQLISKLQQKLKAMKQENQEQKTKYNQQLQILSLRVHQLEQFNLNLKEEIERHLQTIQAKNLQISSYQQKSSSQNSSQIPQKLKEFNRIKQELEKAEKVKVQLKSQLQRKQKKIDKLNEKMKGNIEELKNDLFKSQENRQFQIDKKNKFETLYLQRKQEAEKLKRKLEAYSGGDENRIIIEYQQQIEQLNQIIGEKNKKIQELNSQIDALMKRIDSIQDNYISQQQLDVLHKCIQGYQNKMNEVGGIKYNKLSNKTEDYFHGKIFQEKLIYELKNDNIKLIEALNRSKRIQPLKLNIALNKTYSIFDNLPRKISYQAIATIKNMSTDLYSKLDRIEQESQLQKQVEIRKNKSKQKQKKSKSKKSEDKMLYMNNDNQISISKIHLKKIIDYLNELMRQDTNDRTQRSARNSQRMESSINSQQDKSLLTNKIQQLQQKVQLFQQKNLQCQQRIKQLLLISSTLRQQLDIKNQTKSNRYQEHFWVKQTQELKQTIKMIESHMKTVQLKLDEQKRQRSALQESLVSLNQQLRKLQSTSDQKQIVIRDMGFRLIKLQTLQQEKVILKDQVQILSARNKQYLKKLKDANKQLFQVQSFSVKMHKTSKKSQSDSQKQQNLQYDVYQQEN